MHRLIALADGLVDRNGKPLGTDFSNVYAAGVLTLEGRPGDAYDPALQHAAEEESLRTRDAVLRLALPALLSDGGGGTRNAPLCMGAVRLDGADHSRLSRGGARDLSAAGNAAWCAAAFPAVFINLGHGQNGFLTAALLGGALLWLDRGPRSPAC